MSALADSGTGYVLMEISGFFYPVRLSRYRVGPVACPTQEDSATKTHNSVKIWRLWNIVYMCFFREKDHQLYVGYTSDIEKRLEVRISIKT